MKNTLKKLLLAGFAVLAVFVCAIVSGESDTALNLSDNGITVVAQAAKSGYYTYEVSGGKAKIVGVDCEAIRGKITIPSKLGGYPVTELDHCAFVWADRVTSVVIPNTVTRIGSQAFQGCYGLTSVTIPKSVKSIGFEAFLDCIALTSVTIPDSVTRIESGVFTRCTALKSVTLPANLTEIPIGLFKDCISLKSVTIPGKVKLIDAKAFIGCTSLKSISIPDTVTEIGEAAFKGCTSLASVKLPKNLVKLMPSLFEGCTSLKSIVIPDKVSIVWEDIFSGCTSLSSVVFSDKIDTIAVRMFYGCSSLKSITIPDSVTNIQTAAFADCTSLKSITMSDSVTSIGEEAFSGCTAMTSIRLPANINTINKKLLADCKSLKAVTIPEPVSRICAEAFKNCSSLESISFPKATRSIGKKAFEGCTALKAVVIPSNVQALESAAFAECTALETVTISRGIRTISDNTFRNCTSLRLVTIADKVTNISGAFINCTAIKKVFYTSSEANWKKISGASNNKYFANATITYNSCEHIFSDKITKEATCQAKGTKAYICTKCSYRYSVALKKVSHKYEDVVTAATLTKNGKIENKCIWCSKVSGTTVIYYPKTIKLSKTQYTYNGSSQTPKITITDSKGNVLTKNTDYTVKIESGRTMPGKYTVTITFKGNYSGTKKLTYTIIPKATTKISATQTTSSITLTWNKVTGADGYRVYQYNASKKEWVAIQTLKTNTLKVSGLKSGTTYKFKVKAYKNDEGAVWGVVSAAFTTSTKLTTPKITSLTTSKGKAALKWSDVSGESGYVVYYSTKKDSGFTKLYSCKADASGYTKYNLTSGKIYYFKVRAYKTVGDKTVFSAWSEIKSIKIK